MLKYKDISEFNRRIVIETGAVTRDAHGGETKTWSTLITCWAKVEQVGTSEINEKIDAQRVSSIDTTDFYIRYRDDVTITEKMRLYYHSKYYDIEAVVEVGNFDFIMLKCRLIE